MKFILENVLTRSAEEFVAPLLSP